MSETVLGQPANGTIAPTFTVQIQSSVVAEFISLLKIIGYAPILLDKNDSKNGITEATLQISPLSGPAAQILSAWMRTCRGVAQVRFNNPS